MKYYSQIHFSQISEILMQAAMGVAAVCGNKLIISDMIYSLSELAKQRWAEQKEPFYIAIREMGTESGSKAHCAERFHCLGYPLVIAKIEADEMIDWNMNIKFCWIVSNEKKNSDMEQEFNSL